MAGALCSGLSFAVMQWFASSSEAFHLMTDVVSGVFSVVCTALFLRFVWHPRTRFLLRSEREALPNAGTNPTTTTVDAKDWKYAFSAGQTAYAWAPWAILIVCCAIWGIPAWRVYLNNLFSGVRSPRRCLEGNSAARSPCRSGTCRRSMAWYNACPRWLRPAQPEVARFAINWLSASGRASSSRPF